METAERAVRLAGRGRGGGARLFRSHVSNSPAQVIAGHLTLSSHVKRAEVLPANSARVAEPLVTSQGPGMKHFSCTTQARWMFFHLCWKVAHMYVNFIYCTITRVLLLLLLQYTQPSIGRSIRPSAAMEPGATMETHFHSSSKCLMSSHRLRRGERK